MAVSLTRIRTFFCIVSCFFAFNLQAQFTHQDTLRGSLNANRSWWNVLHYDITVEPHIQQKSLAGEVSIKFKVVDATFKEVFPRMQIDLQAPMQLDSAIYFDGKQYYKLYQEREGNTYLLTFNESLKYDELDSVRLYYHGVPQEAKNPPWQGGLIWSSDKLNRPFVSLACQGKGASVWYPCKDHQSDEPDSGAILRIIHSDTLVAIGNGNKVDEQVLDNNKMKTVWQVSSSINTYNIVFYIGKYLNFYQNYIGLNGSLPCQYYALDYNISEARQQFKQVPQMLQAFEHWFGPYPFYVDGYKLVEAPHLGMEHQSAIAYGNKYKNGYRGTDLSGSGWGKKWDYIIVHESGHEWWGNNVSSKDIADMWIHEGFTMYSEALFVEYYYGKEAATEYVVGVRSKILNDKAIIGPYGVNREGSGDMYYKGANLIHHIRCMLNDDEKFRMLLQKIQKDFAQKQIESRTLENFITDYTGLELKCIFDQYLRRTQIPVFQFKFINDKQVECVLVNASDDFEMPMRLPISAQETKTVQVKKAKPFYLDINMTKKQFRDLLNANYFVYYEEL